MFTNYKYTLAKSRIVNYWTTNYTIRHISLIDASSRFCSGHIIS